MGDFGNLGGVSAHGKRVEKAFGLNLEDLARFSGTLRFRCSLESEGNNSSDGSEVIQSVFQSQSASASSPLVKM